MSHGEKMNVYVAFVKRSCTCPCGHSDPNQPFIQTDMQYVGLKRNEGRNMNSVIFTSHAKIRVLCDALVNDLKKVIRM